MKVNKYYFKSTKVNWLRWFMNLWDKHLTLRFTWAPSLLLDKYREKYWEEWDLKYLEVLEMLDEISETGLSPFVLYVNDYKEIEPKKESTEVVE